MSNELNSVGRRRVIAHMTRGKSKDIILTRRYVYFDTAMSRMLQLSISYANEGDFIEFVSIDFGIQLGILRILKKGRFEMEMNDIVKDSPSLLKLMTDDPGWGQAMLKPQSGKSQINLASYTTR